MPEISQIGKLLIFAGASILIVGLFLYFAAGRLPIGKLPGDIYIKRGNFTFYFPVVTGIVLSVIISIILNFFRR